MTRSIRIAAVVLLLVGLGCRAVATAEEPCAADAAKYCSGIQSTDPSYVDCMKKNLAKLSKGCQREVQAAVARANDLKLFPNCVADAEKLCPSGKPGASHVIRCLRGHQSELSSGCKNEIRKRRGT